MLVPQTLLYAVRSLRRSKLTGSFVVITLAICTAAVAVAYSIVDAAVVRALPFTDPDRLLWVSSISRDRPDRPFSLPEFMDYRRATRTVQLGAFASWNGIVEAPAGAQRLQGLRMSGDALRILGATPSAGRLLQPYDDNAAAPRVLLLSYAYWMRAFAGDAGVIGRSLVVNGGRVVIVGVLPQFFPLPVRDIDAVVPLDPESDARRHARGSVNFLRVFARLEPGQTVQSAQRELNVIAAHLREQFPNEYAAKVGVRTLELREYLSAAQRPTLFILFGAVALMLIVAIANVMNLLLARANTRRNEMAVRLALGASARQIVTQLLVEATILVAAAGACALALVAVGMPLAVRHLKAFSPRLDELRVGPGAISMEIGLCLLTVIALGLAPIVVSRSLAPHTALRGGGRSAAASRSEARWRSVFVVSQMALALVVTTAATSLVASLVRLQRVDLGYRPDSVFLARLALPPRHYQTTAELADLIRSLTGELQLIPGVTDTGMSSVAPLSGLLSTVPFAPVHNAPASRRDWPSASYRIISPGYFAALGARRRAGRMINEHDDATAIPVAVINRSCAERFFRGTDPIGRQIFVDDTNNGARALTVVGIVDDLRETDLDGPARPDLYLPAAQVHPDALPFLTANQFWAVRVHGDASAFGAQFSRALRKVDPSVATARVTTLRGYVDEALASRVLSARLLAAFTATSLILTMLGVYGITAYSVEQRGREIGIRTALGATPAGIMRLILARTIRLTIIGLGIGVVGVCCVDGFASGILFNTRMLQPTILLAVSLAFIATALAASWLPGRRAARLDTTKALALG